MATKRRYYQTAKTAFNEAMLDALKPYDKSREVHCPKTRGLYVKIQITGKKTFYVVCRVDKKRVRTRLGEVGSIKLGGDDGAVAIAKKIIGQAADGINQNRQRRERAAAHAKELAEAKAKKLRSMTLAAFLKDKYGPWVKESNRTGTATLKRLGNAFTSLNNTALSELTPDALDAWRAERLAAGITKATVNRDMTSLKSALAKGVEWNVLLEHPLLGKVTPYRLPKKQKPKSLTPAEEKQLLEALPTAPLYLQTMVLIALYAGLRRGEIFQLQWSNVDMKARTVTVKAESTKSNEERTLPMNDTLTAALGAWQDKDNIVSISGLVFPGKKGAPLNNIKRSWRTLRTKAKIEHFTFHGLRHTFAQKLVDGGIDILTVRDLMGHVDISTTQIYLSTTDDKKREAVASLCT